MSSHDAYASLYPLAECIDLRNYVMVSHTLHPMPKSIILASTDMHFVTRFFLAVSMIIHWELAVAQSGSIGGAQSSEPGEATYPKLTSSDIDLCRKEITAVHQAKHNHLQQNSNEYCRKNEAENCANTRRWLSESAGEDPVAWFIAGNSSCDGTDWPCYGLWPINDPDVSRFIDAIQGRANGPDRGPPGMAFDTTPADKCISKVWLAKYVRLGGVKDDGNEDEDQFGALAIDKARGNAFGWAVDFDTQAEADASARAKCAVNSVACTVVMRFKNTCASYAADQARGSSAYGWGQTSPQSAADARALRECASRGGARANCTKRVWGCTGKTVRK